MLERWQTPEGRSSYQVIADETGVLSRDSRLLDLACGDGYLLDLLARLGFSNLIGVDLSLEELSRARERLGPCAELSCQDAHALTLPAGSVEVVVCHMALMLMEPVEPVLAEIARILEPGGRFIAVVNRYIHDPVLEVYRRRLHRTTAEIGMNRLHLGDPRAFTAEGLCELIDGQGFDREALTIQDFEVRTRAMPSVLWSMLRLTYDVFQLPESAQATLEGRLLRGWESLMDEAGLLTCSMGMRLLKCHTPLSSR
jgi:SAM-dependent methyltransferase